MVTLIWHACKYKAHKLHQRYILEFCLIVITFTKRYTYIAISMTFIHSCMQKDESMSCADLINSYTSQFKLLQTNILNHSFMHLGDPFSGTPNGLSVFSSTVPACGAVPPKTDPLLYTNSLEIFKNEHCLSSVSLLTDQLWWK